MDNIPQANLLFFQNSILPDAGGVPRVTDIISRELTGRGYSCYYIFYEKDNPDYSVDSKLKVSLQQPYRAFEDQILQFVTVNNINIFICQNAYAGYFIRVYGKIRSLYPALRFFCFLHASPDYWQQTSRQAINFTGTKFLMEKGKKWLKQIIYPFYNPYVRQTAALYKLCDKFVLLSDSFKPAFTRLYITNRLNNKLVTIPNPLTFDHQEVAILQKKKVVLMVSRLAEVQKKISSAIRIWQQVQQQGDNGWQLVIVGSGPDEGFYRELARRESIGNIVFAGQHTDVLPFYRDAAIFMMTSVWEGMPMSLLEAQQNGVVPIAFDNFSALYDVVKDGESGYVIRNNDPDDFSKKLLGLMADDELREHMALQAIAGSERYRPGVVADEWEQLFKHYY